MRLVEASDNERGITCDMRLLGRASVTTVPAKRRRQRDILRGGGGNQGQSGTNDWVERARRAVEVRMMIGLLKAMSLLFRYLE